MEKYLYYFGYQDQEEFEFNDGEGSTGVFIQAENEKQALQWGREISEAFMKYIHRNDTLSWKAIGYAHWVEKNYYESDWSHCLDFFQVVKVGVFPQFYEMTTER